MAKSSKPLERGDIIYLDFDPQAGSEIMKRRPAIVISPKIYNIKSRLILCCPITSNIKDNPWEVKLPDNCDITGVVLSNHLSSMDQHARSAQWICKAPAFVIKDVLSKAQLLIL